MSIAVDTQGNFGDYLNDPQRKISEERLYEICKAGKREKTCRYIGLTGGGFACVKNSPMQDAIDKLVKEGKFTATSDNCGGLGESDS